MTFDEYQANLAYPTLGLVGEAGEVANKVKKVYRDRGGKLDDAMREQIAAEAGDCIWYLAALADELGMNLDKIAADNLAKLATRSERKTLGGSGDER